MNSQVTSMTASGRGPSPARLPLRAAPPIRRRRRRGTGLTLLALGPALLLFVPSLLLLGAAGCDDDQVPVDREPPAVPRGITSITGDMQVTLLWYPNAEWDLSGYRIYRSLSGAGYYSRIDWISAPPSGHYIEYVDRNVENGVTYYYAVSAVDDAGNESGLSPENVFDTPRPAGRTNLRSYETSPRSCAYDFSSRRVTDYDDPGADIAYVNNPVDGAWMLGLNEPGTDLYTALQDAGFAANRDQYDSVTWAPAHGWSPSAAVELIEGHVYIVWTRNDHYAKLWVRSVYSDQVEFDWAYQTDPGNQELKQRIVIVPLDAPRPPGR